MIIGIVALIIFLFSVYQLTRDDFVFLRKNVSVEQMFNLVFLGLPVALLTARLFYIAGHPSWHYFNPLVFFVVPYFPGLSLPGGILGAMLFLYFFTRKKMPQDRVIDVLMLSFLISLTVGLLLTGIMDVVLRNKTWIGDVFLLVSSFITFLALLRRFMEGKWLDGMVGYTGLFIYIILEAISYGILFFTTQQIITISRTIPLAALFLTAIFLLGRKGRFISKAFRRR